MDSPVSFFGLPAELLPADRLECGVCWTVYDPAEGDDTRGILPGTAFADLPEDWCCPGCDAAKARFLVLR